MDTLKSFIKSMVFLLLTSFVMALLTLFIKNENLVYLFTYLLLALFFIIFYKDKIINDAKNLKKDLTLKNILIPTSLFILCFIANIVLIQLLKVEANNEIIAEKTLLNSPILTIPYMCIFAPIVEEMTYRLPYKKNKLSIFISTLVFALLHIVYKTPIDLIFIIPYFILSSGLSYAYFKNENILMSIIMHIINNSINIMVLFI